MPMFASGSSVEYRIIKEATYGILPPTPALRRMRLRASKLGLKKDTYKSEEVTAERGTKDLRHGMKKTEGTLSADILLGDMDLPIEAVQQGTWTNGIVRTGSIMRSFCIEQAFLDINQFRLFTGQMFNKMKLQLKPGSMAEITFDLLGQDMTTGGVTNAGSLVDPTNNSPVSYAGGQLFEGGTAITYVTGIDLELDNNMSGVGVIGADVTPEISNGSAGVKGSISVLFKDQTMANKFMTEAESSLMVKLTDPAGATLTICVPRLKYTDAEFNPPKEGNVIITMPFEGLLTKKKVCTAMTTLAVSGVAKTFTRVGGSFITDGFVVGDVVTASGLTNGANNTDHLVTAVTANVITVASTTLVDQAAGVGTLVSFPNVITFAK